MRPCRKRRSLIFNPDGNLTAAERIELLYGAQHQSRRRIATLSGESDLMAKELIDIIEDHGIFINKKNDI